ncbi:MAG: aminoglycoside phosphotransferase family protein [Actinomycetota bacterium]|nr:aminoglycoside phosphotransferase family protein [Actinomycetota bacterium]
MADASLTLDEWRQLVPDLLARCAEEWDLQVDEPYSGGWAGHAVRVRAPDGTSAALKLIWPHRESEYEAEALELWDGAGSVRLLRRNTEGTALLLERCEPGAFLSTLDLDAALDVYVGLLPRLWKPAGAPFHGLEEEALLWLESLPREWELAGRPFERALVDAALEAIDELAPTQGEQVLLHQDLHALNVLSAEREPWLAIDPKPLVGEREFGIAPVVRGAELRHGRAEVLHRLARLTAELELDPERARGWCVAQTVAWGVDVPQHLEVARWLLEDRE